MLCRVGTRSSCRNLENGNGLEDKSFTLLLELKKMVYAYNGKEQLCCFAENGPIVPAGIVSGAVQKDSNGQELSMRKRRREAKKC